MRMLNPPHPGDFIYTEIIEAYGLTVTAAAKILGVSRPTLSSLLNGKASLPQTWRFASKRPLASTWKRSCACSLPTISRKPESMNAKSACGATNRHPRTLSKSKGNSNRLELWRLNFEPNDSMTE